MPKEKVKKTYTDKSNITYKLLSETDKTTVNKLIEIYKEKPLNARVKYFNDKSTKYQYYRLVLLEYADGNFSINYYRVTYGISVTSRMYHHDKLVYGIVFKNNKFYFLNKEVGQNSVKILTHGLLTHFIRCTEGVYKSNLMVSVTFNYMRKRFPWIQVLNEHPLGDCLSFNRVLQHKLFSYKDISRDLLKVPNNICEIVIEYDYLAERGDSGSVKRRIWLETLKVLEGAQNLTKEFIDSEYFRDTCKMAKTLGKKVNCRWKEKRLKEEHDVWAREISNIVLDCEPEYPLKINAYYHQFADFSDYKLLKTNKEMLIEGMVQNHCVGTYIERVNKGECAIYHVKGFTLQLALKLRLIKQDEYGEEIINNSKRQHYFEIKQFKGHHNQNASLELHAEVQNIIDEFAKENLFEVITDSSELDIPSKAFNGFGDEELPF